MNTVKMLSPICPMFCEKVYLNLKEKFEFAIESVHLCKWPTFDESKIDENLISDMEVVRKDVSEVLAAREKEGYGVRWPLACATLSERKFKSVDNDYKEIIMNQCNLKEIKYGEEGLDAVSLDTNLTPELECEGYSREVMRLVQSLRRKEGLVKTDKINLYVDGVDVKSFVDVIKEKVGAVNLTFGNVGTLNRVEKNIKGKTVVVGFEKV